jgi:hypothetical protein
MNITIIALLIAAVFLIIWAGSSLRKLAILNHGFDIFNGWAIAVCAASQFILLVGWCQHEWMVAISIFAMITAGLCAYFVYKTRWLVGIVSLIFLQMTGALVLAIIILALCGSGRRTDEYSY